MLQLFIVVDELDWHQMGSLPVFERVMCQVQDVDGRSELFSIGAGTVYVGCLDSRPCLYVTTRTMQDWVDERWGDDPDVPAGAAVAYHFDTEERRTAFVRGKDWNRLVEGYLKEEMWELFKASASVEVSRQEFEVAYIDALDAIRELPCKACGALDWPVITTNRCRVDGRSGSGLLLPKLWAISCRSLRVLKDPSCDVKLSA